MAVYVCIWCDPLVGACMCACMCVCVHVHVRVYVCVCVLSFLPILVIQEMNTYPNVESSFTPHLSYQVLGQWIQVFFSFVANLFKYKTMVLVLVGVQSDKDLKFPLRVVLLMPSIFVYVQKRRVVLGAAETMGRNDDTLKSQVQGEKSKYS